MKNYIVILGCLLLATILFFGFGEGQSYGGIWRNRLLCLEFALAIGFVAHRLGQCLLWRWWPQKEEHQMLTLLLGFALGTWFLGTLVLIFGSLGWLSADVATIAIVAINIQGWREWKRLFQYFLGRITFCWPLLTALEKLLLVLVLGIVVFNFAHALLPPLDYDVLEYHLGAPALYYQHGKVFFLADNVYANFPQNLEMTAFLSMLVLGKWLGAITAQILLQFYGLALFLAVYLLAKMIFGSFSSIHLRYNVHIPTETFHLAAPSSTALIAALLMYCLPWTADLLRIYYVEIPQAFLLVLMLTLWYDSNQAQNALLQVGQEPYRYTMMGILLGIAVSFKYTALFFGIAALGPLLLWQVWQLYHAKHISKRVVALSVFLFSIGFLLAFSPWAIRGFINTSNPIYPLFQDILAPHHWSAQQYAKFRLAHAPEYTTFSGIMGQLGRVFLTDSHNGILFLSLLIPGVAALWWRKLRPLAIFSCIWVVLWIGFTHQISRFIFIVWVLLAISMAYLIVWLWHHPSLFKLGRSVIIILLVLTAYHHASLTVPGVYDHFVGIVSSKQIIMQHHPPYPAEEFIQENIPNKPSSGKILLVGEARTFYLDHDIVASTVFDNNLLETLFTKYSNPSQIAEALRQHRVHYLYFHWNEVLRLQETYTFTYQNQQIPGYLRIPSVTLNYFLTKHCKRIFPKPATEDKKGPGEHNLEIYELQNW